MRLVLPMSLLVSLLGAADDAKPIPPALRRVISQDRVTAGLAGLSPHDKAPAAPILAFAQIVMIAGDWCERALDVRWLQYFDDPAGPAVHRCIDRLLDRKTEIAPRRAATTVLPNRRVARHTTPLCEQARKEASLEWQRAAACQRDDDCMDKGEENGFACHMVINRHSDARPLERALSAAKQQFSLDACTYKNPECAVMVDPPACVSGLCATAAFKGEGKLLQTEWTERLEGPRDAGREPIPGE